MNPFPEQPVLIRSTPGGWKMPDWGELWAYRDLLWMLTVRDVKVRYKQAVLGCAWAVLQPLSTMAIFSVIFGLWVKLPSEGAVYPVFISAGLLPWTLFSSTVATSGNSLVGSAGLITKVYFPRIIIPLSSLGVALMDFLIALVIMAGLLLFFRMPVDYRGLAALPALTLIVVAASVGVGMFLSALNVAYRDFRYVIPVIMQVWMYANPIVYSSDFVPARWKTLYYLNPMAGAIDGFRSVFLGRPFDWGAIGLSAAVSLALCAAGIGYFKHAERRFSDVI